MVLFTPLAAASVNLTGLLDFLRSAASTLAVAGGTAAVLFFIIGAIQLNFSSVHPHYAQDGKSNMIHAVISALLCGGALYIINTFLGGFGLPTVSG